MPVTAAIIVAILGLALYLPTLSPKINEIGRIMFAMGLLAWLLSFTKSLL